MMIFKSETELKEQIRIHQRLSAASTISLLCGIISLALFAAFLFYKIYICSIVCFLIFAVFLTVLLLILKFYKKESAEKKHYPYEIILKDKLDYEQIKCIMSQSAESGKCRDFQDKSAYLCFINKKFKSRILLIHTQDFNKPDFDSVKKSLNKAINKEYKIPQMMPAKDAYQKMRINIIAADEMNEALYNYISRNAETLLTRVEGIINFVLIADRLIIPPLYGETDSSDINLYKKSIQLMKELLN